MESSLNEYIVDYKAHAEAEMDLKMADFRKVWEDFSKTSIELAKILKKGLPALKPLKSTK